MARTAAAVHGDATKAYSALEVIEWPLRRI